MKRIITISLLISITSIVLFPCPVHAESWGSNMMAAIWKQTTEQMVKKIQDTILANLKIAALRIIQAKLFSLLGFTGNKMVPGVVGYIISDWKMFIYSSATQYSNLVVNDFFNNLRAGTPSALQQRIINPAQRAVNTDYWNMRPNLQYYVTGGDPTKIFTPGYSQNPMKAFVVSFQEQNSLAFNLLRAEGFKKAAYEQEAEAKKAEGQAGSGYASKKETTSNRGPYTAISSQGGKVTVPPGSDYTGGEKITTPGSMIKEWAEEVVVRVQTRMLSLARSVPEIITNMVSQMITQVIQQGVTNIISGKSSGSQFNTQIYGTQMQYLIQSGVRQMASPNMFFGR